MHSIEAGFLDFLKRTKPPVYGHNPLSNVLSPKVLGDVLSSKLKWGVRDVDVHPTRNGVEATFAIESGPLNLNSAITKALTPLTGAIQEYANAPVSLDVEFDKSSIEGYALGADPMTQNFPYGYKVRFEMGTRALQASTQRVARRWYNRQAATLAESMMAKELLKMRGHLAGIDNAVSTMSGMVAPAMRGDPKAFETLQSMHNDVMVNGNRLVELAYNMAEVADSVNEPRNRKFLVAQGQIPLSVGEWKRAVKKVIQKPLTTPQQQLDNARILGQFAQSIHQAADTMYTSLYRLEDKPRTSCPQTTLG